MPVKAYVGTPGPMVHHRSETIFWTILKNGHTMFNSWLGEAEFALLQKGVRPDRVPIPDGYLQVTVWREPFARYVSGLAQMWRQGQVADVPWDQFVDGVDAYNRRIHDANPDGQGHVWTACGNAHFFPQHQYVPHEDCRKFRLDNLTPFVDLMAGRGVDLGDPPQRNVSDHYLTSYAHEHLTREPVLAVYDQDRRIYDRDTP